MLKLLQTQKFLSLSSSAISAITGAVSIGLLARALTKDELGQWVFFQTIFTFFELLRSGIVSSALIRGISSGTSREDFKIVVGSSWYLCFIISVCGSVVMGLGFGIFYFVNGDTFNLYCAAISTGLTFLSMPAAVSTWVSNAELRFNRLIIARLIPQFTFLAGAVCIYLYDLGILWVLFLFVISSTLSSSFSTFRGWNYIRYAFRYTKQGVKQLFDFGKYSVSTMMVTNLFSASDIFVIQAFLGADAVALYSIPQRLVAMINTPLSALINVAFPSLSRDFKHLPRKQFAREFEKNMGFTFLILAPLSVLIFVFSDELVVWLGGEKYLESSLLLRIFAVYTLVSPLDRFTGMALDIFNRPGKNFYKVLLMLLINVVGNIIAVMISEDVYWVAVVSIFTFSGGVVFGFYFIRDILPFQAGVLMREGTGEVKRLLRKYLNRGK